MQKPVVSLPSLAPKAITITSLQYYYNIITADTPNLENKEPTQITKYLHN